MFFEILNIFFFLFHVALIVFNVFGWAVPSWRKWNLYTLLATAFSWFILGAFYGFGYCFLTDWHWSVRERLGYSTDSNSYIHFLITTITPFNPSENTVDIATAVIFVAALAISVYLNIAGRRRS